MTLAADTSSEPSLETPSIRATALAKTRPFYWSVRRELWEARAVFIAPLIAAGVALLGCLVGAGHLAHGLRGLTVQGANLQTAIVMAPIAIACFAIVVTTLIVAVFYCQGALHNERRDRSILFWKSLPVSDLITVLAKASVPLVVMPIVTLVVIVATALIILMLGLVVMAANGVDTGPVLSQLPSPLQALTLPYALIVLSLWYAPIVGWLLLVSGWARRAPFLWAVLPPMALGLIEKIAFGTGYVGGLIHYRLSGGLGEAFSPSGQAGGGAMQLGVMDPLKFAACPGLWAGLVFAAVFLAAAIWMRRNREPI